MTAQAYREMFDEKTRSGRFRETKKKCQDVVCNLKCLNNWEQSVIFVLTVFKKAWLICTRRDAYLSLSLVNCFNPYLNINSNFAKIIKITSHSG
jgi:hypothetical protein